jgi:hypothetical protein
MPPVTEGCSLHPGTKNGAVYPKELDAKSKIRCRLFSKALVCGYHGIGTILNRTDTMVNQVDIQKRLDMFIDGCVESTWLRFFLGCVLLFLCVATAFLCYNRWYDNRHAATPTALWIAEPLFQRGEKALQAETYEDAAFWYVLAGNLGHPGAICKIIGFPVPYWVRAWERCPNDSRDPSQCLGSVIPTMDRCLYFLWLSADEQEVIRNNSDCKGPYWEPRWCRDPHSPYFLRNPHPARGLR